MMSPIPSFPFKRIGLRAVPFALAFGLMGPMSPAWSATVGDDFGGTIGIEQGTTDMKVGDMYYTVDAKGKKKAIIQLESIDGTRVSAKVLKGTASPGEKLVKRPGAPVKRPAPAKEEEESEGTSGFSEEEGNPEAPARKEYVPLVTWGHRFALAFGATYTTLRGSGAEDAKYRLGYMGGFYYIANRARFSIQTGLQYYQMGYKAETSGAKIDANLDYLGVPIVARFNVLNPETGSGLLLKAGFMAAQMMSAKAKITVGDASTDLTLTPEDKMDYLAIGGLEYQVLTYNSGYWLDFTYLHGVKSYKATGDKKISNSGMVLSIGFMF